MKKVHKDLLNDINEHVMRNQSQLLHHHPVLVQMKKNLRKLSFQFFFSFSFLKIDFDDFPQYSQRTRD
jgi:hypothetical protein